MGNKRIISEHDKRISLRCPVSITESSLLFDKSTRKYNIKITMFNDGNRTLETDTVESALIVIRCKDGDGGEIRFADSEYLAKTVKFGEGGLSRSESVSITVVLDLEEEIKPSDFEMYISRIRFADRSVLDYLRDDFFNMPGKPVPIIRNNSEQKANEAIEKFGATAAYIPEKLTEVVWRCTCGEMCDTPECPMCGSSKEQVFEFFADLMPAPVVPAVKKPSEPTDKKRIAIVLILAAIALILGGVLLYVILSGGGKENTNTTTTAPVQTEPITTEDPGDDPMKSEAALLAFAYAARNDYENALSVARSNNCPESVTNAILEMAVDFCSGQNRNLEAYGYAIQISGYADLEKVTAAAYNECLQGGNYDKAVELAESINNSQMKIAAIKAQTDLLCAAGDYVAAYEKANSYKEEGLAGDVLCEGVDRYRNEKNYEKAVELARLAKDSTKVAELAKEATVYYVDAGDLDTASYYAAASGDGETIGYLCDKLSNEAILRSYPTYASYLSSERKRELLASRLSAGSFAACIAPDGAVLFGAGEVYVPEGEGIRAVSVATSGRHTVVLCSDGSVKAFGDNTYGQCNVSVWDGRDIVMIAVGRYHTVALTNEGDVLAIGRSTDGQTIVSSMKNKVMIAAGEYTTLSLGTDGRVSATGRNTDGQCETASWRDVVSISAGPLHSVGITTDGKVVSCGSLLLGMRAVSGWSNTARVYAGSSFTLGLDRFGNYSLTGAALSGSVGSVQALYGAIEVAVGDTCMIAMSGDGKLRATGALAPDVSWINEYVAGTYAPADPDQP